jgi:hypothetical protein
MTEPAATGKPRFEGRMFLYEQPELLTKVDHDGLGLANPAQPFEFVRSLRALPLVSVEFGSAQRDYPIIFTDTETPTPVAMVGVVEDVNLFVDDTGNWDRECYVPAYIRCYPVAFAAGPNDQLAVVIDRAAHSVTREPEIPFFDGEKMSAKMQERVDFCARYDAERKKTNELCNRLKELNLFTGQQITQRPQDGGEGRPLGAYLAIDREKLGALDSATVSEFHRNGTLSAIYAHLFSLENWNRLLDRRERRGASPAGVGSA